MTAIRFLGPALRLLRRLRGLEAREVAKRAGIGRSRLAAYEKGEIVPSGASLFRLLKALEADFSALHFALIAAWGEWVLAALRAALNPQASSSFRAGVRGALLEAFEPFVQLLIREMERQEVIEWQHRREKGIEGSPRTVAREALREEFRKPEARHDYADVFLDSSIALQIKALRQQRGWTQEALAKRAGLKPSQVSAMEQATFSSWTLRTLRKLARAFDLALSVRFESFGWLLDDALSSSREALERPSFEEAAALGDRTTGA